MATKQRNETQPDANTQPPPTVLPRRPSTHPIRSSSRPLPPVLFRKHGQALGARAVHLDVGPDGARAARFLDHAGWVAVPRKGKGLVLADEGVGVVMAHGGWVLCFSRLCVAPLEIEGRGVGSGSTLVSSARKW
jgi:hypothetical protein